MYTILTSLHSTIRWVIVIIFSYSIIRAYYGWLSNKVFTKTDKKVTTLASSLTHLQLLVGIWLYFISPIVSFFLNNFSVAIKLKEFRFFGLEHSLMMITGIILFTIGSSIAKRKESDRAKFKTIAIWFTAGFILILSAIPYH